ncbi:Hypothetical predicted protein [Octopus vulgaris]|uniref:Uncharacterized protein n=1 Tax=Octopus vulgaris TaxID=6645 RepID=A0AA36EVT6_OCTVU|nr:Hypothetical predicted protein [Octopus vulgaris]
MTRCRPKKVSQLFALFHFQFLSDNHFLFHVDVDYENSNLDNDIQPLQQTKRYCLCKHARGDIHVKLQQHLHTTRAATVKRKSTKMQKHN